MNKTKKVLWIILAGFLLLNLVACGSPAPEAPAAPEEPEATEPAPEAEPVVEDLPEMTISLSHNQSTASTEHLGAEAFKEKVEALSEGKITVDIFPSLQLGSMREQAEAVQMGSHQMTLQPTSVLTPFIAEFQLVDLPFLWPSSEVLWDVLDGPAGQAILDAGADKGFHGLGYWGSGFKQFTTKGHAINSPADFNGVVMRVMPSPLLIAQYEAWGANPVPIEYAELYNALQQGTVDGQENPIQTIQLNKFYEVQDNMIISNHGFLAYAMVANKGWFDGLPEAYQDIIIQAEKEAREIQRAALAERETEALEEIAASGINLYELSEEGRQAFFDASQSVHEAYASTDKMKEILEMIYSETGAQ